MRTILMLSLAAAANGAGTARSLSPAAGNVTLPLDEYNRLVEAGGQALPRSLRRRPFPFTIKRAEMKFQVTGDAASGHDPPGR